MTIDLARIKEAAEKATKGPWKAFKTTSGLLIGIGEETGEGITDARGGLWGDAQEAVRNADHIASCDPQTILQLVAVVEAALTIDAAFKRAGTQGVTMDWGPVLEALQPFTTSTVGAPAPATAPKHGRWCGYWLDLNCSCGFEDDTP